MSAVFNFLGTVFKTTVVATGVVAATVAGFAYVTKPNEKMLEKEIEKEVSENGPSGNHLVDKIVGKAINKTSTTNIKDYIVLKTADVTTVDGEKRIYLGVFQNWIPITSKS